MIPSPTPQELPEEIAQGLRVVEQFLIEAEFDDGADVVRAAIAALARVERLENTLQQMLKPFPCASGPPEDALEDWMAAVGRFRAAARSALSEAPPQGEQ